MFRRNPDAVALIVIGLLALAFSVPRMLIDRAHWNVTPLKMEVRDHRDGMRLHLEAERKNIQRAVDSIRRSIHE